MQDILKSNTSFLIQNESYTEGVFLKLNFSISILKKLNFIFQMLKIKF